jgi:hypothetical protein
VTLVFLVCIWQLDVPTFGPNTGYREDIKSFSQFLEADILIDLNLGENYFKEYPL